MKNREAIQRAVTTTTTASGGGILNDEQAAEFIQTMFDSTDLMQRARTETMAANTKEFPKIGMSSRIARGATENDTTVVSNLKSPTFGKVTVTAKKYALPWALTEELLEDNIEGEALEARIANMMATQFGLDMEDLAINGDTVSPTADTLDGDILVDAVTLTLNDSSTYPRTGTAGYLVIGTEYILYDSVDYTTHIFSGLTRGANDTTAAGHSNTDAVTWSSHPLIGNDDGWLTQIYDGAAHYVDLSTAGPVGDDALKKDHFFKLVRALPQKYRRGSARARLVWLMSADQASVWREYLTNRGTPAGDQVLAGGDMRPLGIPIVEVTSLPDDMIVLADPQNLMVGMKRTVKMRVGAAAKEEIMQDVRYYNTTVRFGTTIEELDAIAYGDGLAL